MTEAVAHLFRLMPRAHVERLIREHLLPTTAGDQFSEFVGERGWVWRTQVSMNSCGGRGQIDLLLQLDDATPLLAIESKISAPHGPDQLKRYGKWISECCCDSKWPGAVVLLTHWTPPPKDFLSDDAVYGAKLRRVAYWPELYRSIRSLPKAETGKDLPAWRFLADDLCKFMEEQDMAAETIITDDLAILELYTRAGAQARVTATFRAVRQRAESALSGKTHNFGEMTFDSDGVCIWQWAKFSDQSMPYEKTGWIAYWGLLFPGKSEWWRDERPAERCIVVGIGSDVEKRGHVKMPVARLPGKMIPSGWTISDSELIAFRSFFDLEADGDELGAKVADWVAAKFQEIMPVIEVLPRLVQTKGG